MTEAIATGERPSNFVVEELPKEAQLEFLDRSDDPTTGSTWRGRITRHLEGAGVDACFIVSDARGRRLQDLIVVVGELRNGLLGDYRRVALIHTKSETSKSDVDDDQIDGKNISSAHAALRMVEMHPNK